MESVSSERELLLRRLAGEVSGRGLAVPAIFMLELYKPLMTLLHSACQVSLPLLVPLFGLSLSRKLLLLLESREGIERLIQLIEEPLNGQSASEEASRP